MPFETGNTLAVGVGRNFNRELMLRNIMRNIAIHYDQHKTKAATERYLQESFQLFVETLDDPKTLSNSFNEKYQRLLVSDMIEFIFNDRSK